MAAAYHCARSTSYKLHSIFAEHSKSWALFTRGHDYIHAVVRRGLNIQQQLVNSWESGCSVS